MYSNPATSTNAIEYAELIVSTLVKHLDDEKDCQHCKILLDRIFRKINNGKTQNLTESNIVHSLLNDTTGEFKDSDRTRVLQDCEH
ncbi:MAG TPA: hypothetical protein VJS91_05230 [Nitrososphaeraceae archaeon]|nr:hypothetical protein [Nitrososphaeraceae archaeon]